MAVLFHNSTWLAFSNFCDGPIFHDMGHVTKNIWDDEILADLLKFQACKEKLVYHTHYVKF
jgi:hypothetical protein